MHSFVNGYRCLICNESKGERKIRVFLELNNIKYIQQHRFKECRSKRRLAFDFYIPSFNALIEYDGKHHYEIIDAWGGVDEFINVKIRDTIKNIYAKEQDINLIRIPYWEFDNIENILSKELKLTKQGKPSTTREESRTL